jgi:hypothetical protein
VLVVTASAADDLDDAQGLLEILQHFPARHSAPTQLGTEPDDVRVSQCVKDKMSVFDKMKRTPVRCKMRFDTCSTHPKTPTPGS